jgi:hypothetical protein
MIGGIIILSLLLTALGTMVYVTQQYDQYQTQVSKMSQYDIQRFSENLVAIFPGLQGPTLVNGCGGSCNQYNMTISNMAGIGIQIARIYINSTGSGCTSICVLDLSTIPNSYKFRQSDRFINSGEPNHGVLIWLPSTVTLPNPSPPTPMNSVFIVTTRGRVFTFQWPFAPVGTAVGGQSGAALSTGVMKIAYQGTYDSKNEGPPGTAPYCHTEPSASYPAAQGYRETLTGITGVTGNSLTFVNPWITDQIMTSTPGTTLYFYTNIINPRPTSIIVTGGSLVLNNGLSQNQQYYVLGTFFGVYYQGTFYAAGSSPNIPPNTSFYAIFRATTVTYNTGSAPMFFLGWAAITNQAKDGTYYAAETLIDGLWVRSSC